jgi:hypothetical protein
MLTVDGFILTVDGFFQDAGCKRQAACFKTQDSQKDSPPYSKGVSPSQREQKMP